jgi:hypothetical protein
MARLASKGIEVYLPRGWEGRIFQREPTGGARTYPVAHFSTFALPADMADFKAEQFHPYTLRRGVGGQSGTQWFFTEQRRPLTLYVVLGSHAKRHALVPRVNLLLKQITVLPAASAAR